MKKSILLIICVLGLNMWSNATVYYVSSAGNNTTGDSWTNAFTSPGKALATLTAGTSSGQHEVWVAKGTYSLSATYTTLTWKTGINFYGGFTFGQTARTDRSTDASLTILDGINTYRVLTSTTLLYATTWDGFTIQNGYHTGGAGGALLQRNAILQNCIVQNCKTTNYGGGGIAIGGVSTETDSIKVLNCIIRNNTVTDNTSSQRGGGGIQIKAGSFCAVVRGCTIDGNISDGLAGAGNVGGAGIHMMDGKVENCTISNNVATNKNASGGAISYTGKCQGGGILVWPQTTTNPITIKNCTITGNSSQTYSGGGICIDPTTSSVITAAQVNVSRTIITNNFVYKYGGGVATDRQSATATSSYAFENCVIANNRAENNNGGGVFVNNTAGASGAVSFTNCNIVNNRMTTFSAGGAGIYYNSIPALIKNCVLWGNTVYGASPLKHNVRTADITGNQILNCAIDSRFSAADVNYSVNTTTLTGLVTVETSNSGSVSGKFYTNFASPTNFTGNIVTANVDSIALITNADWSISFNSACLNTGATVASPTNDIIGTPRPQGAAYDIGAYEVKTVPVLDATVAASAITSSSASSGGNITGNGGASVTARGVCWNLTSNPDIASAHTSNGTGTGSFTSNFTGLQPNKTYYVRAYATNSVGTGYGAQVSFTTLFGTPTLTFGTPTSVSKTYGDALFTNAASSSNSSGAITYSSGNTNVATVDVSTGAVTIVGAGSSVITATIAANGDYNSGLITYTVNVSPASQTITFGMQVNKNVGDADFSPATASSGLVVSYSSTNTAAVSIDGTTGWIHIVAPGTTTITASQTGNGNYNAASSVNQSLTVNSSTITVSSNSNISTLSPTSAIDLTVSAGYELTVNADANVKSITVAPGAKLTLNNTSVLTSTNGITLQNTASGTASFVDSRTADNPSVLAGIVQQDITETNRNWYVAVPVSGKSASDITLSSAKIIKRNEGFSSWDDVSGSLTAGVGYIAVASTNSGTISWSLNGNLNSGKVEVPVTNSGASSTGYNLLGNPYPSYLNWEQVLNLNATNASLLQSTIWYRTATFNNGMSKFDYSFNTYNSTGRMSIPANTTGYIPPMQAFWVLAGSAGTVTFTNAMRSHGDGASNKLKAPSLNQQQILRLQVSNAVNSDETLVYFNPNASNAYDNFDSPKMSNNIASIPEIFTMVGTEKLVINGMNSVIPNQEIPLGFSTGQSNTFTIKATEISNFNDGTQIFLKDSQTNNEWNLTDGSAYNFSSDISSSNTSRFSVIFKAASITTGIINRKTDSNSILIYRNVNNLISINCVTGIVGEASVSVYNAVGQKLAEQALQSSITVLNRSFTPGVYLVSVRANAKSCTQKVVIN
ncbi:MAG: T9SS type A sorting domain-containing protein [Paludibacter sp.]